MTVTETFPRLKLNGEPGRWRENAACRPEMRPSEMTPAEWTAVFFPPQGGYRSVRRAQAVCAECPVRVECDEFAMSSPVESYGVWGGRSGDERRRREPRWKRRSYSEAQKQQARAMCQSLPVAAVSARTGVPVSTIYDWLAPEDGTP